MFSQLSQSGTARIPGLDGLRALSVSFVIIEHLTQSGSVHLDLGWIGLGNLGVRIFFVISGFIVTTLLMEERKKYGSISLKAFYIRRAFRILPIWSCYVGVILLGLALTHRFPPARDLWGVFTFNADYVPISTVDLAHLWSLSVEEKFYLIWPAALVFAGTRRSTGVAWIVVFTLPFVRLFDTMNGISFGAASYLTFHHNADALAVGCLLALLRPQFEANRLFKRFLALPFAPGWILLLVVGIAATQQLGLLWWVFGGITILNLTIAVCVLVVIQDTRSVVDQVFQSAPVRRLGVWSYGIYLWQQPLTFHRKTGWLGVFPLNVIVLFFIAGIGYHLIEKRAQQFGRSIARPAQAHETAPANS